jgi:hypothetical protein
VFFTGTNDWFYHGDGSPKPGIWKFGDNQYVVQLYFINQYVEQFKALPDISKLPQLRSQQQPVDHREIKYAPDFEWSF